MTTLPVSKGRLKVISFEDLDDEKLIANLKCAMAGSPFVLTLAG